MDKMANLASANGLEMLFAPGPFEETRCSKSERNLAMAVAKSSTSWQISNENNNQNTGFGLLKEIGRNTHFVNWRDVVVK